MTTSGVAPGEPIKVGQVSIQYLIDLRRPSNFLPKLLRRHLRFVRPPWRCRNIPRDPDTPDPGRNETRPSLPAGRHHAEHVPDLVQCGSFDMTTLFAARAACLGEWGGQGESDTPAAGPTAL